VTGQGQLELDRLTKRYGEVQALDGLTFTVPPGQVFGFLGPNGAGKTTAMRAIVGVAAMDSGTVRWGGEPIAMAACLESSPGSCACIVSTRFDSIAMKLGTTTPLPSASPSK